MKLISLEIFKDGTLNRNIAFKDGLNLVTNIRGSGRSGNSVGKSTLSRVIDFLFMGSIDAIYIDEEFGHPNHEVEYLFKNHDVVASLSFIGTDGKNHVISRNFAIGKDEKKFQLDGKAIEESVYEAGINLLFYNVNTRRPSVRAITPKFVRNNTHRMLNTTKFLDGRSSKNDYSEMFLFLFSFSDTDLLTQKRDTTNLVKRRKRNSQSLNAMVKEQKPKEEIKRYQDDIESLEEDFLKFDYAPEYSDPVARLSELQKIEDSFATSLVSIDRKIQNIEKTISILDGVDNQSYLSNELRAIYEFAGAHIDGAIKEFDEVINFHANLVSRKKEFLREDLPDLLNEKEEVESEIAIIYREKTKVFSDMRSTESIANITEKLRNLGSLKVSLGKLEGLLEQQKKASEDLHLAEADLQRILNEIKTEMESVHLFESEFSKKFQALTKEILGQEYTIDLNYNEESGISNLEVSGGVSNPEGGKKKAEVISFDFSYIHTASKLQIKRPLFVFHDSIEDIDQRQIDTIFTEANKLPGQQIISMLSDSLSNEFYEKYLPDTVLLLSEDDKFFKL